MSLKRICLEPGRIRRQNFLTGLIRIIRRERAPV